MRHTTKKIKTELEKIKGKILSCVSIVLMIVVLIILLELIKL